MKRTPVLRSLSLVLVALFAVLAVGMTAGADEKPRIAVLEFKNKADNQWWGSGGAQAMQDVFVTELVKSGKFRVVDREQLAELMREKNLALSGDVSTETALQAGRLLGVQYFLTGAVTEYGASEAGGGGYRFGMKKTTFKAAVNARIIDAETGDILWADEASGEDSNTKVSVRGYGGGVEDDAMFDKVMKPVVQQLVASIKAADL